jgi:hypothetical protein
MTRSYSASVLTRAFALSVACGFVLATPAIANAQVDEFGRYYVGGVKPRRESSRNFALEVRFGPYLPRVDSEFSNGATPFKDYYGTTNRVMLGTEFDWLPLTVRDTLRFGVGGGISYTTMSTKALIASDHTKQSAQDTRLRILPQWVVGVARVDILNRRTPIPLVFVGKLGLANGMWWVSDDPSANRAGGIRGRGMSYGVYYGAGLQVDLSFLDPYRSKHLDVVSGINSISLFGEFYGMELNGFGASNTLRVGDRTWVLGLELDF